jgi:hypothetical protein
MQQPEHTQGDKYVLSKEQFDVLETLLHKAHRATPEAKPMAGLGGIHVQQLQHYEVHHYEEHPHTLLAHF